MGSGHRHGAAEAKAIAARRHKGPLTWALALTVTYMVAEVVGGLLTGSLALLADAAHMLSDAGGLGLALVAVRFAERPATPQRTFGYLRFEVLPALLHAVVLLLLSIYILYEAYKRYLEPPEVLSGPMLGIAIIGLIVNLISMRLLATGSAESLNVKGAYFEVLSDMLGSLGVIVAAVIIMTTGWTLADPIIGAGIGLFIIPRTWNLLRQVIDILLEGTPPEIDIALLAESILAIPGVISVHHLGVWTITSELDSMTCHVVVADESIGKAVLAAIRSIMKAQFNLDHIVVQIESKDDAPS